MFLDAPVEHAFNHRKQPWKASSKKGPLTVQPRDTTGLGVGRQSWVLDQGGLLRHRLDGRVLDVNFWDLKAGRGVNLNVGHTTRRGASWELVKLEEVPEEGGLRMAEVLTEEEPPPKGMKAILTQNPAPYADRPLAEGVEGKEFFIAVAAAPGYGIAVFPPEPAKKEEEPDAKADAEAGKKKKKKKKDEAETKHAPIKLAKLSRNEPFHRWRLVDGDSFQNVGNGEFLDSELKYAFISDPSHPWEGNHTDLRTAPRNLNGQQKWVYGPEEFYGGKILRHYLDGRGVDVHGWNVENHGNDIGVENSVHGDCKGLCYIFRLCCEEDDSSSGKEPEQGIAELALEPE